MGPWSHPKTKTVPGANAFPLSIRKMRESGYFKLTVLWELSPLFLSARQLLRTKSPSICPLYLREANGETRPAVLTIFARERPAERFDDATRNRQPHSGPFGLCRKEWLEKLLG